MSNVEITRLLNLKKRMAKKRPTFQRVESWRYKRLLTSYRRPKGCDNKSRMKMNAGIKTPNIGYRTPKKVRGLHPSGLKEITITNIKEVNNLSPKEYGVKISSKVGANKRKDLIEALKSKKFTIFNIGIGYSESLKIKELNVIPKKEDNNQKKKSNSEKKVKKPPKKKEKNQKKQKKLKNG
jgi:large subunit ribosomal protein L32e